MLASFKFTSYARFTLKIIAAPLAESTIKTTLRGNQTSKQTRQSDNKLRRNRHESMYNKFELNKCQVLLAVHLTISSCCRELTSEANRNGTIISNLKSLINPKQLQVDPIRRTCTQIITKVLHVGGRVVLIGVAYERVNKQLSDGDDG